MNHLRFLTIAKTGSTVIMPTPSLPRIGERVVCSSYTRQPGGRGAHTAIALARLGYDSLLSAKIGTDYIGQDLCHYLSSEHVDIRFVAKERQLPTSVHIRLSDEHDRVAVIEGQGAAEILSPSDVSDAFISYPDAVILYGNIPPAAFSCAIDEAARKNIPIFIMSGDFPSGTVPCQCPSCEIFSVNASDAARLTGIQPANQELCMKACLSLSQMFKAKHILIRLENRGCFYFDGTYYHFIAAYDISAKNKYSADSAFIAGFVSDYMTTKSIRHACEYGELTSAVYLSLGGSMSSYPTPADIQSFAERNEIVIPDDRDQSDKYKKEYHS